MHTDDTADAFVLTGLGVEHGHAGFNVTGVDAEEAQVADEGVGGELEDEAGHGGLVIVGAGHFFFGAHQGALHFLDVEGRRQVGDDSVEEELNAHVAESGTAHNGNDSLSDGGLTDAVMDVFFRQGTFFEVLFHHGFILFSHGFHHFKTLLFVHVDEVGGDFFFPEVSTLGFLVEHDGLTADQVHNATEFVFDTDGQLEHDGVGLQAVADGLHRAEEVGADTVHLVDEADTGDVVSVSLTPNGFRLGLNAVHAVEHGHSTVEHAQGTFDFDGEVHVAGGVDDVDGLALPLAVGGSRGNGDAAFLFLFHPVHGGLTFVSFTNLVGNASVEKDTFGGGSLTGVNMGHDADIAQILEFKGTVRHSRPTSGSGRKPCWLRPYDGCLRASSRSRRGCCKHRSVQRRAC